MNRSVPIATTSNDSAAAASSSTRLVPSRVLDWKHLEDIATEHAADYRSAAPFPHVALDNLFAPELLEQAIAELPGATAKWTTYDTVNEAKQVCSDASAFGPAAETIVHALNSAPFVNFLERLTGIAGLIPDPHLRAAGYMMVRPGGFLGLHYDFATQKELKLDRRINVLLYLNRDWRPEWGGQLELHSNDALDAKTHREVTVEPLFNRLLIFNTPNALHGHRRPIQCPPGHARLCLSWYYYTSPPVPGWASRMKPVKFRGRFDLRHSAITWLNRLVPPILFDAVRALRGRGR